MLAATCNIFVCFVSWVLFRTMTDRYKNTMTRQRQNSHGGELHLSANDFIENLNASEQNNATEEIVNSGALHDNFRPSTTRFVIIFMCEYFCQLIHWLEILQSLCSLSRVKFMF